MQTYKQFVKATGAKMRVDRADSNPNMEDSRTMDHWRCVIRTKYGQMTLVFSMGYGHNGKEPDLLDVLDCLASDAADVENSKSFEDWCDEYGYSSDSRKAERTYNVCQRQAKALERICGDHDTYESLLFETERR